MYWCVVLFPDTRYYCTTWVAPYHFAPRAVMVLFVGDAKMAHREPAVLELFFMGFSLDTAVPPPPPTRLPTRLLRLAHSFPPASDLRF